jgi:hypothetical protein
LPSLSYGFYFHLCISISFPSAKQLIRYAHRKLTHHALCKSLFFLSVVPQQLMRQVTLRSAALAVEFHLAQSDADDTDDDAAANDAAVDSDATAAAAAETNVEKTNRRAVHLIVATLSDSYAAPTEMADSEDAVTDDDDVDDDDRGVMQTSAADAADKAWLRKQSIETPRGAAAVTFVRGDDGAENALTEMIIRNACDIVTVVRIDADDLLDRQWLARVADSVDSLSPARPSIITPDDADALFPGDGDALIPGDGGVIQVFMHGVSELDQIVLDRGGKGMCPAFVSNSR